LFSVFSKRYCISIKKVVNLDRNKNITKGIFPNKQDIMTLSKKFIISNIFNKFNVFYHFFFQDIKDIY
jgi:hypothetical protein